MANKFQAWPSIDQFRQTVKNVISQAIYVGADADGKVIVDRNLPAPTMKFIGTTKIHGTNGGIGYALSTGEVWAQSRNQVVHEGAPNNGFYNFVLDQKQWFAEKFFPEVIKYGCPENNGQMDSVIVFGEWCGPTIQKGVAVSYLREKKFIIFGVGVYYTNGTSYHLPPDKLLALTEMSALTHAERNIYSVFEFGCFEVEIDFNQPEKVQNLLGELTKQVEDNCPVGAYFGITENTIGEGIVWTTTSSGERFKVKGEKHSVTKVKTLASVDVEKLNSIDEFVTATLTENSLQQGVETLRRNGVEIDVKTTGEFVKWVTSDIFKEESDTLEASGLSAKEVGKALSTAARKWYHTSGELGG